VRFVREKTKDLSSLIRHSQTDVLLLLDRVPTPTTAAKGQISCVTRVVVPEAGGERILGYDTLLTRTIESAIVPDNKKLLHGPLRIVFLGRLAVDRSA
jgi:hypothetical protein